MGSQCCTEENGKMRFLETVGFGSSEEDTLAFLGQVELFTRLPVEQLPALVRCCEETIYQDGQIVIAQGDEGHEFFLIKSGEATVHIDGKRVAVLRDGDFFGEQALLHEEPRKATITACGGLLVTLKITREQFVSLGLRELLEFKARKAVGGGGVGGGPYREVKVHPPSIKKESERKLMEAALKKNANLANIVQLDTHTITSMIEVMWREDCAAGVELISQGDEIADYFYIVQSGSFTVTVESAEPAKPKLRKGKSAEMVIRKNLTTGTISAGNSFGELALLYVAPRAATVKAAEPSVVWVIDRDQFKQILARASDDKSKEYVAYLDHVESLSCLHPDEKLAVAKALTPMNFIKSDVILQQGEVGDTFYILTEGEVKIIKDGKDKVRLKATRTHVKFLGEHTLLHKEPVANTAVVCSAFAETLSIDQQSFNMLLGPLSKLKERGREKGKSIVCHSNDFINYMAKESAASRKRQSGKILRKDLKKLGLLGCGGFGAVELVEHTKTGNTYALKALSKGHIVKSGTQKSVISEKNVQMMCDSDFIVRLYETYNGAQSLYFLLELALGGELYTLYNRKGLHGNEKYSKFYLAGIVYAFDHLHSKKIIFRDLKPENVLLTDTGQCKLADMGLAKVVVGKTFTTCGTPDYFAPELIASSGHTVAVDWWTLGILAYELMAGAPPFEAAQPMQIYQKIQQGIGKVNFPPKMRGSCEDFVKGLCHKEPSSRIPMKKDGIVNITKHKWYTGFKWDAMKELKLEAPYKPNVKNNKDLSAFKVSKSDLPPQINYKPTDDDWDKDFATSK